MAKRQSKDAMYLLKGIPQATWDQAKAKAAAERPPLSMKWVLIALLEKWVGAPPDTGKAIPTDPPTNKPPKQRRQVQRTTAGVAGMTHADAPDVTKPVTNDAPDLGSSF